MKTLPPPCPTAGKRRDSGNGNVMGVRGAHNCLQINEFGRFYQIIDGKIDIALTLILSAAACNLPGIIRARFRARKRKSGLYITTSHFLAESEGS